MPATFSIPLIITIPGQIISASLWNSEFENIDTNFVPAGMDDYSATDGQMQTATDPFPAGSTSRATSLQGEIERLRFQLANITGETYWYNDPDVDIATFKTRFDAHTHDGTSNQGPQIAAGGLASNAVTTAKILDANVTDAKINDVATSKLTGTIATAQIANAAVDENKLAASVAGNGLAGGAGSALAVNVDSSTIEISSDSLRVKDAGITQAKLATAVVNQLGQNIGLTTIVSSASNTTLVNYTGQGRLKVVASTGAAVFNLTIDGILLSGTNFGSALYLAPSTDGSFVGQAAAFSIDIFFKTSLVVTKVSGAGALTIIYERAA